MSGVVLAPETMTSAASPQHASPKRTDDASTLAKDLLGVTLIPKMMVRSVPDVTSPPSIDQEVPSVFHPIPFRFSFDPPSDPATVSSFARAYPNLPGYHMWSTWDRVTAVSTSGPAGSEEEDDPDFSWDFSGLDDPGAMRDFMSACDHCLSGCSNDGHGLGDGGNVPNRQCFHIDQADHDEGNHFGMPEVDDPPGPASRVDISRELAVVPVPAGVRTHSSSKSARCRPSSTRKQASLCSSVKTSSRSGQGRPAPHRRQCQGNTASSRQRVRPGPSCSGDATSNHARAIHHRGSAYPGQTHGSPGRRRSPMNRELHLPKAS
jgi:hypothetical protein